MHPTMEVNAALWKLVNGEDIPASAQLVVDFMLRYPETDSLVSLEINLGKQNSGSDAFTAHTDHGDVTVKKDPESSWEEKVYGVKKERVGHFRIWRGNRVVTFHHYWASGMGTESSAGKRPGEYRIVYSESTKKVERFGHAVTKTVRIGLSRFNFSFDFSWFLWDWKADDQQQQG